MNERKLRRFCTAMILFAMLTRLLGGVGAGRFAFSEDSAEAETRVWPVRLLAAKPADEPSDEIAELPVENSAPPERQIAAEVTKLPEAFSAAEADAITIAGACSYAVDEAALLTRPSALTAKADGPKVLIVHTHTSEAYTPEPGWEYESSDPLRTGDAEHSVVRLGTRVAELLNAHGIETLHDTALNDYPSYNGAYERMRQTIEGYLAQYPSIEMVLDLHRDAANDPAGMPVAFTAEVDGARCALCLDDGMLLGAARRRPFCEVELELVSGEAAPMLAFAAYLQEHHALREERKSKFVRASELVD